MNTTQINDEFAVNVKPEVIISGKFIYDIVTPVIKTIWCLNERCLKFNSELVIRIVDLVEILVLSRIGII